MIIWNITSVGGFEGRVLCMFQSWMHTILPWTTPGLWQTGLSLPDFQVYDCSNMCNYITFSCCKCFVRLQLKHKYHPSLSIPFPCSSLTLHLRIDVGQNRLSSLQNVSRIPRIFIWAWQKASRLKIMERFNHQGVVVEENSLTSSSQGEDYSELSLKFC